MKTLIVEDDHFYATQISELLRDHGFEVAEAASVGDALSRPTVELDLAIVDIMLPNDPASSGVSTEEVRGGFQSGIALARRLRKEMKSGAHLILLTGQPWGDETSAWAQAQGIPLVRKHDGPSSLIDALRKIGLIKGQRRLPQSFIVHGHDEVAVLQLKNYVQNTLKWAEPTVLREMPNRGRTLIEKFEETGLHVDCIFVLLTPDDQVRAGSSDDDKRRSRQNVIFELGFFYGQFGRKSGRVIALYKGPNELPSDIQGVVYINIDRGVESAGEEIRREVDHLLEKIAL